MDLKERIIKTTSDLFYENGIKSVTMDFIAETMGISKRTLYEIFTDKNELVDECFSYTTALGEARIKEVRENTKNIIEMMMTFYIEGCKESRKYNKNYMSDLRKFHPTVFQKLKELREKSFGYDMIIEFDKGIVDGYIRPDLNTGIMAILIREQIYMIEDEMLPELRKFTMTEIFETAFMSFIRGISTSNGLQVIDEYLKKAEKIKN